MPRLTRDGYRHWLGRRNGVCLGQPQAVRTGKAQAVFTESRSSLQTESSGQTLEATTINPNQDGGLTVEQKQAFKEVFDLFDVNGGGTIDVGELDASLRSVGINVDQSVLVDVVQSMDENGNDEIDFDEFLEMMTDNVTEIMGSESEPAPKNNRGVFFAALRQFMNWSSLRNMEEIEKFYQAKTKPKQPHVVSHYAAGARLIGLTDKQLIKHLKTLKAMHAQNGEKSPYAQPLLNLCDKSDDKIVYDKSQKMSIKKQTVAAAVSKSNDTLPRLPVNESPSNHGSGDVATTTGVDKTPPIGGAAREKELTFEEGACQTLALRIQALHEKKSVLQRNPFLCKKECKDRGWVSHRSRFVSVKLPGLARFNEGNPRLSTENVAAIRAKVDAAKDNYYRQISRVKTEQSIAHWSHLVPQSIQTNTLRRRFRRVFCDYTTLKDSQLPPLCAH